MLVRKAAGPLYPVHAKGQSLFYFVPGKFYHLTHRCHNRKFLFKFARDRNQYRQRLSSSVRNYPITVFAYCVTSNHTHVLARSESETAVSEWMQENEGEFAQSYNRRKGRSGPFGETVTTAP